VQRDLSIVIPHRNHGRLLERLLASIEAEAKQVEVVVVDDGSTALEKEVAAELVARFAESELNQYWFLDNEGAFAGGARNTGLKHSESLWVLFADADDVFLSGWFDVVQTYFTCASDVVYFAPRSQNEQSGKEGRSHQLFAYLAEGNRLRELRAKMLVPWSKLFRRSLILAYGIRFDEVLACNDVMFSAKSGAWARAVSACAQPIYCKMEQVDSLSSGHTLERLKCRASVMVELHGFLQANFPDLVTCWGIVGQQYYLTAQRSGFRDAELLALMEHLQSIKLPWSEAEANAVVRIKFDGFQKVPGRVDFLVTKTGPYVQIEDSVYFEFNRAFIPSDDVIALALAVICGQSFHELEFDLSLTEEVAEKVGRYTLATVKCSETVASSGTERSKEGVALSFSGGFDSLAAWLLMPASTKLVSVDFGGSYGREAVFFQEFAPYTLATNFRDVLKADVHSRIFMGAGAILYRDYLDLGAHAFGWPLDNSIWDFSRPYEASDSPLAVAGLDDLSPYVLGLCSVGVVMVVTHYCPDLVAQSLASLAAPDSVKRYRKKFLVEAVNRRFKRDVDTEVELLPVRMRRVFGTDLTEDMAVLYVLKHLGMEAALQMYGSIPSEVVDFVHAHSLKWFEKLHPDYLDFIPAAFREAYVAKLRLAGVTLYEAADVAEFEATRRFYGKYNRELRRVMNRYV